MITRLKVKNYRSIEEIDLTLSPLTVLVGKNGAGKSTILDVLAFVRDALHSNIATAFSERGGIDSLLCWTPNKEPLDTEILVEFTDGSTAGQYSFTYAKRKKRTWSVKHERYVTNSPDPIDFRVSEQAREVYLNDNGEVITEKIGTKVNVDLWLRGMGAMAASICRSESSALTFYQNSQRYYSFYSSLATTEFYDFTPAPLNDRDKYADGAEKARFFAEIFSNKRRKAQFYSLLRRVVPNVDQVHISEVADNLIGALSRAIVEGGEAWYSLVEGDDSTLRVVGLLVAFMEGYPESTICIDNLDTSLYPVAVDALADIICKTAQKRQIIIATNSPALISTFKPEELRVVEECVKH